MLKQEYLHWDVNKTNKHQCNVTCKCVNCAVVIDPRGSSHWWGFGVVAILLTSLCYISSVIIKLSAGSTNINLKWVLKLHVRLKCIWVYSIKAAVSVWTTSDTKRNWWKMCSPSRFPMVSSNTPIGRTKRYSRLKPTPLVGFGRKTSLFSDWLIRLSLNNDFSTSKVNPLNKGSFINKNIQQDVSITLNGILLGHYESDSTKSNYFFIIN